MKDARSFLEANREALRTMPLWLFSSGPLGDGPDRPDELADVRAFADDVHARDHRVFDDVARFVATEDEALLVLPAT